MVSLSFGVGETNCSQGKYVDDGASKENLHFDDQSNQVAFLFSARNTCSPCFYLTIRL